MSPPDLTQVRAAVDAVPDPELPVLTLADLGIVRQVRVEGDGRVEVELTPTFTGCPATEVIVDSVRDTLVRLGVGHPVVRVVLAPAWSTDWISAQGRRKLLEYGIAPPTGSGPAGRGGPVPVELSPSCPRCAARRVRRVSRFGSKPCTSLWACQVCGEPFDAVREV